MKLMGGLHEKEGQHHHHLNKDKQSVQDVGSLVHVFNEIHLFHGAPEDIQMYKIVKSNGNKLHEEFISERLQDGSKTGIHAPLVKVKARIFKKSKIVGEYELSTLTRSFMKADGEYNAGGENKEELDIPYVNLFQTPV